MTLVLFPLHGLPLLVGIGGASELRQGGRGGTFGIGPHPSRLLLLLFWLFLLDSSTPSSSSSEVK